MKFNCPRYRETDLEADLLSSLNEGDLSGKAFDAIRSGIRQRKKFIVTRVELDSEERASYKLKIGTIPAPFMVEDEDLEAS